MAQSFQMSFIPRFELCKTNKSVPVAFHFAREHQSSREQWRNVFEKDKKNFVIVVFIIHIRTIKHNKHNLNTILIELDDVLAIHVQP